MRTIRWNQLPNPWNPGRTLTRAEVSGDPKGALALLINRIAADPGTQADLCPDGPGLPFDNVVTAFRAQSEEDLWSFAAWDDENPAPDWQNREIWVVLRDNPSAAVFIEGPDLRALVAEALASLPGSTDCALLLIGDLPTAAMFAALSDLDRVGGDQILALNHRDSPLNHTPRATATLPGSLDASLARALSLHLDGFALVEQKGTERAVFFCGALVERSATREPTLPDLLESLLGPDIETPPLRVDSAPLRPPPPGEIHVEMPVGRVILAGVSEEDFRLARLARPGWRWRAQTSWATSMPWIELDGADPLPSDTLEAWSQALGCAAMSIWIPGEGRPFLWTEVGRGQPLDMGKDQGAVALVERLHRIARHCEEEPGALFGRGTEGWRSLNPP